ncbi:metallophosphoesterase [Deinococcus radiopugnans]|uniref:Metallophosphoesterase n=1 Tax=Deinococcus radiopugnans TaxID=57497 RepID=A0A0A7KJX8_9DEIO|nr:metallophosphoesterase [Deinococcus radiopugnans]AIZ45554.1 metallophosphoesterase [Deinococcus radiopugnans]QLG11277.1 metallophosphoesterase [Deinococcus sp. D7000]
MSASRLRGPLLTRRRVLRGLAGGGLGTLALGGAGAAQAYRFGVTRHTRALPGLTRPVRVALLTDLHYGLFIYGGSVRAWVDATNAAKADLIVLGGDQMDYRADEPPTGLLTELKRLKAPLGVYGVWGNHDYGSFGKYYSPHYGPRRDDWPQVRESLRAAYAEAGVTILRNEGRRVREDLYLAGVDDLWEGEVDLGAALAGKPVQGATLLVSHNPDLLPDLPPGPGLVLCGHTHGGQIRLPLIGAPVVPSRYGQRYAMGWVTGAHGTPAYVSRGLGLSGVPLRNLCEPEVALFTLTPET